MNIQEELIYIEQDYTNPFVRATAFTKIVSYLEEKLGKDSALAHDILARMHFKKSGEHYFLLEYTKEGLEFSYNRDVTSKELGKMVELLQGMKEKREEEERETEELQQKVYSLNSAC